MRRQSQAHKIDRRQLTEEAPHVFYADAGEVGFPPGRYPACLEVPGLGNGRGFEFVEFDGNETAVYRQDLGCVEVRIWSD